VIDARRHEACHPWRVPESVGAPLFFEVASIDWQLRSGLRTLNASSHESVRFARLDLEGSRFMASVPIRFRCFECNQLLGVSRSKAGTVVSCPKCAAELIVPVPEPEPEEPPSSVRIGQATMVEVPPPPAQSSPFSGDDLDVAIDFPDIRPEDIRVRSGVVPVAPPPIAPRVTVVEPARPAIVPPPFPEAARAQTIIEAVTPPSPAEEIALGPAIQTAQEPLRATAPRRAVAPPPRSRDLVIPRSVVTAWSLFVLLALGMAFLAGLLAGHYVWRVH